MDSLTAGPRIAYVVSRFPKTTETFIAREADALVARGASLVAIHHLFRGESPLHEEAKRLMPLSRQASVRAGAITAIRMALRHPWTFVSVLVALIVDTWREPRRLVRTILTALWAFDVIGAMQRQGIEHVHAHFASYPAQTAWMAHRFLGLPYTLTAHATDIFVSQAGLRRKLAAASGVVAISAFHRDFFIEHGADPQRIRLIRNGVPIPVVEWSCRGREVRRGLVVAALKEYKGHGVLFEAISRHRDELAGIELVCVGEGPLRDDLQALVGKLNISDRVSLVGRMAQADVQALMANSDFVVQPSIVQQDGDTEGVPTVLVEAMAVGTPVIGSRVAGTPELVQHGHTGLLVEPGDPDALADAMAAIVRRPGEAARRAASAKRFVREHFDLDTQVAALERLYREAVVEERRISVVVLVDYLVAGGAEKFAADVALSLDTARHRVTYCASRVARSALSRAESALVEALEQAGTEVLLLGRRGTWDLGAWLPLLRVLCRDRRVVVHSHKFGSNCWAAVLGAVLRGVAVVAHEHSWSYSGNRVRVFLDRWLVARIARRFIVVSEEDRRRAVEIEKIDPRLIRVVPTGVAEPQITRSCGDTRRELLPLTEAPLIVAVGQLRPEKAYSVLVDALPLVRRSCPEAALVIAGGADPNWPSEGAALEARLRDLQLRDVVHLVGRRDDVPDLLAAADVFVMSSNREGAPLAVLEALAVGTPVVATAVGEIPALLDQGACGLLVPPGDPGRLAEALIDALVNREASRLRAEAGRKRYRTHYELQVPVRAITAEYAAIAAGSTASREKTLAC